MGSYTKSIDIRVNVQKIKIIKFQKMADQLFEKIYSTLRENCPEDLQQKFYQKEINKEKRQQANAPFKSIKRDRLNRFIQLKKFKLAESVFISVSKSEGKMVVTAEELLVCNEKENGKGEKNGNCRKVSLKVEEVLVLPPFIKKQNLFEKISAKFYKGHGTIVSFPKNEKKEEKLVKQGDGSNSNASSSIPVAGEIGTSGNDGENEVVITDVTEVVDGAVEISISLVE